MNYGFNKLSEEKEVLLHNSMVMKPVQAWSKSIHRYMKFLKSNGCYFIPDYMGINVKGYDTYKYIEGKLIHPDVWSESALVNVGKVLRMIHNLGIIYKEEKNAVWQPLFLRGIEGKTVYSHGDFAPWNIIMNGNEVAGVIDWEFSGPVNPVAELAHSVIEFAQLYDVDVEDYVHLPSLAKRCEQVRIFLDSYGAPKKIRNLLFEMMIRVSIYDTAQQCIDVKVKKDTVGSLWAVSYRARSTKWILSNRKQIEKALK